ncbi:hypothetical protein A9996_04585 [Gelidibacter algens]|nr:hypothetical protein A9996_04585 [Gelidibacter algens]
MSHIFGNIDKAKVTTGYLKEFGVRFNEIEAYNGVINSNNLVDKTQWQSLYNSLYSMRVGDAAASMLAPATVFSTLKPQTRSITVDVLFAAQYYTYQQYKSNAVSNGDVTINNDHISDVAGRNPYDTKTIFGVSPLISELQGDTFSFELPSALVYTNTNLPLSQIQVDFDDGYGYQTVSLNTVKNVSYTSGGEKELKVKFVYSGGPTLYSHSKIYVNYIPPTGQARFDKTGATTHFITGAVYQGATASGLITVETADTDGIFDKPLIVIEGFDPENSFDYDDLINEDGAGGIDIRISSAGQPLLTLNQAIENEGYDLVFVNFVNSTDYIQRNAYMVEAVIAWVNARKALNASTEKNVVLGMSMGGLVARYALRHMETDGDPNTNHDTKLYISHDAPHQVTKLSIT